MAQQGVPPTSAKGTGLTEQQKRDRYKRVFSVLFNITKVINSDVELSGLLAFIARETCGLVGADSCSLMLLDEARRELLSKATYGLSEEEEAAITFRVGEGVAGWVVREGRAARIDDVARDGRFVAKPGQQLVIRSLLCVPLLVKGDAIGVMTVTKDRPGAFGEEDEELLTFLGNSIVLDIENARLYRLAITDGLTRMFNRQYLTQRLPDEIARAKRYGMALSVIMLDIDHFKRINDEHGHAVGDGVLQQVALRLRRSLRDIDHLVRYGGEEFLCILPETDLAGARDAADRLRRAVSDTPVNAKGVAVPVAVSAGVAMLRGEMTDEELLRRADQALYDAKRAGRGRVAVYRE